MPRSPRRRLAEGIFRDAAGLAAVVGVRDYQRERRYPLGTPLEELRRWREETRVELQRLAPSAARGTLEGDVTRYLRQIAHLTSARTRRSDLKAWTARFGRSTRAAITPARVRETMGLWAAAGVAPKTINNRVQTLAHLYRTLDGKRTHTPCDEVTLLRVPETAPVAVNPKVVRRVEKRLRAYQRDGWLVDGKTRARFMVLAATGRRPCELMRAQPEDVDLERRVWRVRTAKGGWGPGVYLNDDMVAAWQAFIAAGAWGDYNTSSLARVLRSCGWPAGVRPYMLRHSVGIALSEAGVDLADVQAHMGHTRIATTRRFYVPVLGSRLEAASRAVEGRLGWGVSQPVRRQKSSQRGHRHAR